MSATFLKSDNDGRYLLVTHKKYAILFYIKIYFDETSES